MDTLEYRADVREEGGYAGPVLWRNKTPQQVCREQYPDCTLKQRIAAPKSLRVEAQFCDQYDLMRHGEDGDRGGVYSTLIPIPEKTA